MQVTEAIRDATVSGRKVKKGQTIVLDPDDGLLAVDNDPQKAVLAGLGDASSRASACSRSTTARPRRSTRPRRSRARSARPRPAWTSRWSTAASRTTGTSSPPSERGAQPRSAPRASGSRVAQAQGRAAGPATLDELLAAPVGQSGIPQVAGLRRVARRLGVDTVRDLLFHLPRRYDDLRELRTLADVRRPRRRQRRVDAGPASSTSRVQQTWRRRVQVTTARLTDGTGFAERDLVRPPVHRDAGSGRATCS